MLITETTKEIACSVVSMELLPQPRHIWYPFARELETTCGRHMPRAFRDRTPVTQQTAIRHAFVRR
jgi:hypothetical protein